MKGPKLTQLLVVAAGLLAYHNSFTGGFVSDDVGSILENPSVQRLWPIWQCLSPPPGSWLPVVGRPLINLSLAINYALGGYNVWGYHALNLAVHILAGLTLLGIVRRTLLQPRLRDRFGAAANELALATAVLWTVHPLQTESVTYVIQRAESIMGLFYLLTLYCFIRGVASQRAGLWYGLCVAACALGMASKQVMASAPVIVMLYDRAFLSSSFREAWRRRCPLYLALASTWILLGVVLVSSGVFAYVSTTAQQHFGVRWWEYLATEPGVILDYLRLSVWPSPLCLDQGWPIAGTWVGILPPTVVVMILLGASAWAWKRNPAPLRAGPVWGFLGAWFFLILAPSSSCIPLHDAMCEHRMYLSLATVMTLMVMGLYSVAGRQSLAVFVVVAVGFGFLTWRRNQDYRSEMAIRVDAVTKFPNDPAAHCNLGVTLGRAGRIQEAIKHLEEALRINPDYAKAHYNLGLALAQVGRAQEAVGQYEQTLRFRPDDAELHYDLANALLTLGKPQEAIGRYEEALRIKPDYPPVQNNLAWLLATLAPTKGGDPARAVTLAQRACEITDNRVAAYLDTLAAAYAAANRFKDAITTAQKAIELARAAGQLELVSEIEARLQRYRNGRAYRLPIDLSGP